MKHMNVLFGLVVLALGFSLQANAEFFPGGTQAGVGTARISVGVSVTPRYSPMPIVMPVPMPYPQQSCGGYNPCGGSHGGFYGGGFYGGGYGYGMFRPFVPGCGHRRCARFTRCCFRRGPRSAFALNIRVGGFGLGIRSVSF